MKPLLKWTFRLALALILVAGGVVTWLKATTADARDLPPLKNGDIVFQDSGGSQGFAIMLASRSLYTHVGLIELTPDGKPMVIEAVGPVQTVPLEHWIPRGSGDRITIKRIKDLTDADARKAIERAHVYDGRPYDIFYYDSRDQIYCSELVHAAYLEGPRITVGKVEKVRDLDIDNAAAREVIESRWQRHPLCQSGKMANFKTCYAAILEQTLVTPASLARDPKLETVYSNFGGLGD